MTEYTMRPNRRKPFRLAKIQAEPPAPAQCRALPELPSSPAALMLALRFALSPSLARLVAEQAGFSSEVITNG